MLPWYCRELPQHDVISLPFFHMHPAVRWKLPGFAGVPSVDNPRLNRNLRKPRAINYIIYKFTNIEFIEIGGILFVLTANVTSIFV